MWEEEISRIRRPSKSWVSDVVLVRKKDGLVGFAVES